MDGSGDGNTPQTPQNLNELQNLLVSFNKEIEDQPILGQSNIGHSEQQIYIENSDGNDSPGTVEVTSTQAFTGFYTEQNLLEAGLHDDGHHQMSVVVSDVTDVQGQDISNDVLPTQAQITTDQSLSVDALHPGQDISLQGLHAEDLVALNDAHQVLRIVSIGNDGQMHIVNEDQLQQGSELTSLSAEQFVEQTIENTVDGESSIIDGTDPVAVLASVAANTSSVSQLQTITLNQGEIHNPQLVALQNSADSSQPQLVAVQNADGTSTEAVQIIGSSEAATISQALLAAPNNTFQTVTLVPSETGPGGEVSYVLIMSSPDGDSVVDGKTISLDMSVYDFKEDGREITEEIVEEDGKTRRILRITPKTFSISTGQMMCSYCNYTSPKKYLLTRHMKTHSEDRPHKCNTCERGFKTLASLTNHVNTHTGVRPHKCKLCESAFTTSGELVRHVRYKHTFEKPHKCTMCEYASVELSKLKRHMRSHTGERPYACPHCTYASPDTYKLKRHLRIHTGEKPYECMICHARFTQSNSLKAHKLIHTGTKPVFQCEYCPTTCGRRTDLKIHVQKLHNSEHPLLCRKCGQTFPDRYTYKIHIKTHEGEKCFKCDTCGHAALSQRHLESHQLIHTGEKPFECNSCEHSFRQKQLLKRHQSLHHTPNFDESSLQEGSEDCQECIKTNRSNLSHTISHSNEVTGTSGIQTIDGESSNSIVTKSILEKNLMQEWRDGKLGNAQQVVIVHPDGTVEEVTHRLQESKHINLQNVQLVDEEEQEQIEVKPDLSQIIIKSEPVPDDIPPIVISALEVHDQVFDETKEAGTQAEIESDADDGSKASRKDENIDFEQSVNPDSIRLEDEVNNLDKSIEEENYIDRQPDEVEMDMDVQPVEETSVEKQSFDFDTVMDKHPVEFEMNEIDEHPIEAQMDHLEPVELKSELDKQPVEAETDQDQRTYELKSELDKQPVEAETDQDQRTYELKSESDKQPVEAEIDQDQEPYELESELDKQPVEAEVDQDQEPYELESELDKQPVEAEVDLVTQSGEVKSSDEQALLLDTVDNMEFPDVSDIQLIESTSTYNQEDTPHISSTITRTTKVASPDRQTRSMKRKERDDSISPAKRTRRATLDQK